MNNMEYLIVESQLKRVILKKLLEDLSDAEIIPYKDSIWFIDKKNKFWYFEFIKTYGVLVYRYDFFKDYFNLFSFGRDEYEPILVKLVEEMLNCKVDSTSDFAGKREIAVEKVLYNSNL